MIYSDRVSKFQYFKDGKIGLGTTMAEAIRDVFPEYTDKQVQMAAEMANPFELFEVTDENYVYELRDRVKSGVSREPKANTVYTKEKAGKVAQYLSKGDYEWHYIPRQLSEGSDLWCVEVRDETDEIIGYF